MFNLFLDTTESASGCNNIYVPIMIVVAVLLIAVMVVFPMITNRKQKKQVEEQRGNLSVGDTVETVGGIIGVVKEIRQPAPNRKELVIETGNPGSSTTLVVDIQALYMVLNRVGGAPVATAPVTGQSHENLKLNEKAETASVDPFETEEKAAETAEASAPEETPAVEEVVEAPAEEETIITPEGKKTTAKSKKTK